MAQQTTRGFERLYLCYDSRRIWYFYRRIGGYILVSVATVARRSLDSKGGYRISGGSDSGSRYADSISGICAYRCKCGTIACYRTDATSYKQRRYLDNGNGYAIWAYTRNVAQNRGERRIYGKYDRYTARADRQRDRNKRYRPNNQHRRRATKHRDLRFHRDNQYHSDERFLISGCLWEPTFDIYSIIAEYVRRNKNIRVQICAFKARNQKKVLPLHFQLRRDGRVVDCGGLENR